MQVQIRKELENIPEGFSITKTGRNHRYYFRYREADKIIKFAIPGNLSELTADEIIAEGIFEVDIRGDRWYNSSLKGKIIRWLVIKLNIILYGDNYAEFKKEIHEYLKQEVITTTKEKI